jgi:hypothetical protein
MCNISGPLGSLKSGTDSRRNMSLSEIITLDGDADGGFGGPHKEEAGVLSLRCGTDLGPGASKDGLQGG